MEKLKQTQIQITVIILSVALSFGMAEVGHSQTIEEIAAEARQAIDTSTDKTVELIKLSDEMIKKKDFKRIPRLYELLSELEDMAVDWQKRTITAKLQGEFAQDSAFTVFGSVVENTANMRLWIGDVHKQAGQFDKAKQMYRSVITNYIGTNYKSQVRKAEFALEDLKEFQKEWNKRKKSAKSAQGKEQ